MVAIAMRVPADRDLLWYLTESEAVLGRGSTFREIEAQTLTPRGHALLLLLSRPHVQHVRYGSSRGAAYERGVTDERHGWGLTETHDGRLRSTRNADVTRARLLRERWRALSTHHQNVLWLAYGQLYATIAAQVIDAADPDTWQKVEAAFGQLAAVALALVPEVPAKERTKVKTKNGGAWDTPEARHLMALCAARGKALETAKAEVDAALKAALNAWWGQAERRVA